MRKIGYKGMIVKFVNCLLQNVEKLIIGIFENNELVEFVVIQCVNFVQAN